MENIDAPRVLRVDNTDDCVLVEFEGDPEIVAFPSWLLHAAKDLARIMAEPAAREAEAVIIKTSRPLPRNDSHT